MNIKVGSSKEIFVKGLPLLPKEVLPNYIRFFCRVLRQDFLNKTITLDVDDAEVTLPVAQAYVGLVDGKVCVDIVATVARAKKLL